MGPGPMGGGPGGPPQGMNPQVRPSNPGTGNLFGNNGGNPLAPAGGGVKPNN
jgi:hypothetical protein